MAVKCIGELNIVEINRELSKRGIETGGTKADRILILEEYILAKECLDPRSVQFEVIDVTSAKVPEEKTSENQSEEDEVNFEKSLINQFMGQMLDRLEGLEITVDKQQLTISNLSESVEEELRGARISRRKAEVDRTGGASKLLRP
jgi:hypothetical protein